MSISDPIADMLTRVRNASRARHTEVVVPASRTKREIARILKDEGFIADVREEQDGPTAVLRLTLKYVDGKVSVERTGETCTAGTSPKMFGTCAYTGPRAGGSSGITTSLLPPRSQKFAPTSMAALESETLYQ